MSFRRYGGLNFSAKHNAVSNNYNSSNNLLVPNIAGLSNTITQFEGNVQVNGSLGVTGPITEYGNMSIFGNITIGPTGSSNGIYFPNGTFLNTAIVNTPTNSSTGTPGATGYWSLTGSNNIYYNDGNVGIGTTTPAYTLDIYNITSVSSTNSTSYLYNPLTNSNATTGWNYYLYYNNSSNTDVTGTFQISQTATVYFLIVGGGATGNQPPNLPEGGAGGNGGSIATGSFSATSGSSYNIVAGAGGETVNYGGPTYSASGNNSKISSPTGSSNSFTITAQGGQTPATGATAAPAANVVVTGTTGTVNYTSYDGGIGGGGGANGINYGPGNNGGNGSGNLTNYLTLNDSITLTIALGGGGGGGGGAGNPTPIGGYSPGGNGGSGYVTSSISNSGGSGMGGGQTYGGLGGGGGGGSSLAISSPTTSKNGGIGSGGGGAGNNGGICGNGGNGLVLLYYNSENITSNSLQVTGNTNMIGNLNITGTLTGATGYFNNITANSFNATSDYRIKNNVEPLNTYYTVDNLNPVTFVNSITQNQDIGVIAHELQEFYPYLVSGEKNGPNLQTVNYTGLIGILIKEIQNIKNEIIELKNDFNTFKK